jgi:hypothetical protein
MNSFLINLEQADALFAEDISEGLLLSVKEDLQDILKMLSYWRVVIKACSEYLQEGTMRELCSKYFGNDTKK